ncbi:hypothetical protein [Flavobacterium orientale]|uniref:EF-hand domain-containing protein n=1 Tax=Flavobacterium orientale TaxID=1756020 RepID=A0A916Y3R7_9FLAO|nr:hypothetical protein [Flavobacterium orientale]GGD29679.1 hypothetical protein GCM10011343_19850 [Flavobacterium orientale]
MNTLVKYFFSFVLLLTIGCAKEKEQPKVIYEANKPTVVESKIDSSNIRIADLPIYLEGTSYLIHPLGDIRVYQNNSRSYSSGKTNTISYSISNYNRYELTGYLENINFQHKDSTSLHLLTTKKVQIQSVTYPFDFAEKTKRQLLIYSLVDMDTNRDGNLDSNDIKSLYISNIDGTNFTKLSVAFHELIDWNIVDVKNRLYFRTTEDINKNGAFDKNDAVHYQFVDLLAKEWTVETYNPLEN